MTDAILREGMTAESLYNAQVQHVRFVHDALMIVRVCPDAGIPKFQAGQYATLGLGVWEPWVAHPDRSPVVVLKTGGQLIRRAYSISCPLLNEQGGLVACRDLDSLEFYINEVAHLDDDPPRLTPRLFGLTEGSRLYLAPHMHGTYTLGPIGDADTVLLLATGTGEAPHNAMIAELLKRGHQGRILSAVCVRYRVDLGYLDVHRELERSFPNYRYLPLTTREPKNVDTGRRDYIGKQYLQTLVSSGRLEEELGHSLAPDHTHVFLCGNPDMIGLPPPARKGETSMPIPGGMVELLTSRGFQLDHPGARGTIHFEKYW